MAVPIRFLDTWGNVGGTKWHFQKLCELVVEVVFDSLWILFRLEKSGVSHGSHSEGSEHLIDGAREQEKLTVVGYSRRAGATPREGFRHDEERACV